MNRLDGKVVIVTGGTKGIGEGIVRGLVSEGAKVVFCGRNAKPGEAIAESLGDAALFVPMDVGREADWERIIDVTLNRFGKLTSLVNNAALLFPALLQDATVADIDACYRANQLGTLLGIKHAIDPMRRNGSGSIINIGSASALKGLVGIVAYSGTKGAIASITRAVSRELAPDNIRVNAVHPGYFVTEMLNSVTDGDAANAGGAMTPLGRAAKPAEIVGTIVYLLSDDSSFVTGAQLAVDGGFTT